MLARIYQPARNAMTSGQAKTTTWVLEFAPDTPRSIDPLMGWTKSHDMDSQVRMSFESQEAAIEYAKENGIVYTVQTPNKRKHVVRKDGYAGNFAVNRRAVWTH